MPSRYKIADALMGFSAGVAGNGQEFLAQQEVLSGERKKALAQDLLEARRLMDTDPTRAAEFMRGRLPEIARLRGNPKDTQRWLDMIEAGDITGATRELDEGIQAAQMRGYLPKPEAPKVIDPAKVDEHGYLTEQLADGSFRRTYLYDRQDDNTQEIMKELRGRIGGANKEIAKRATQVSDNYSKIVGLSKEVDAGNRNATAQALIALVKLGEPNSTVREGEMVAAINSPNPFAVMTKLFEEKGISDELSRSITSVIDPLSPSVINTKDILATANQLVLSQVPTIQNDYKIQNEFAKENLSEKGIQSLFTKSLNEKISGLSGLIKESPPPTRLRFDSQGNPVND